MRVDDPAWSPDGTKFAYSVADTSSYARHVVLAHADGTAPMTVDTGSAPSPREPAWQPDGRKIAFSVDERNGYVWAVSLVDANWPPSAVGIGIRPALTAKPSAEEPTVASVSGGVLITGYGRATPEGMVVVSAPTWSPTGAQLAFVASETEGAPPAVYVVDADGTALYRLIDTDGATDRPAWSPDGTVIAFTRQQSAAAGAVNDLWTIRPGGGGLRRVVTANGFSVHAPAWQPSARLTKMSRFAGADRIDTSVQVSRASFGNAQAKSAVLARHDTFPDALGGIPLAYATKGPLLMTPTAGLDRRVADELRRALPPGSKVYLLGSTASLSQGVEKAVADLGYKPVRLMGADRFGTSVAIVHEIEKIAGGDVPIVLATGLDFPDALTAGGLATNLAGAVLLTSDASLPPVVYDYVWLRTYERPWEPVHPLWIVGGRASASLGAYGDGVIPSHRIFGSDRYATAVAVARSFTPRMQEPILGVASGENFPDALTGGLFMASNGGHLLLTPKAQLDRSGRAYFEQAGASTRMLFIFGGLPSVSQRATDDVMTALN